MSDGKIPLPPGWPDNPEIRQLLELGQHPSMREYWRRLEGAAGYESPEAVRAIFLRFHGFATSPPPRYITNWGSDPSLERWYHRHVNAVLGDVQSTLAGVHYHAERIREIEVDVAEIVERTGVKEILRRACSSGGNTRRWDFEYQAFISAARRTLDYLTRGLAAYFRQEFHSFRKLAKAVRDLKPIGVSSAIRAVHERRVASFDYLLSDGEAKSVRDRINHQSAVGIGALNVHSSGFRVMGGGEELDWKNSSPSAAIARRVEDIVACVDDMLAAFERSVRLEEGTGHVA